jgi:hypothetical protein
MSLPKYLNLSLLGLVAWLLLRLHGRVYRVELATGTWRVQPPDLAPCSGLEVHRQLTDEEYGRLVETWRRQYRRPAA